MIDKVGSIFMLYLMIKCYSPTTFLCSLVHIQALNCKGKEFGSLTWKSLIVKSRFLEGIDQAQSRLARWVKGHQTYRVAQSRTLSSTDQKRGIVDVYCHLLNHKSRLDHLYRTVCSIRPALVVNLVKGSRNEGQAWGCPNSSRHADHQYIRLKKSTYWSSLPLTSAFIALTYHNRFKCYLAWAISLKMTTPNTYVLSANWGMMGYQAYSWFWGGLLSLIYL